MNIRRLSAVIVTVLALATTVLAADISGKWTASFDTQIGQQNYTYEFTTKDGVITATAKSNNGESKVRDVKVDGNKVTFVETLTFQGMDIEIRYSGTIVSDDEIKFTRQVADFATEELVAKRAK